MPDCATRVLGRRRRECGFVLHCVVLFVLGSLPAVAQTEVRLLTWNIRRAIGASDSTTSAQPAIARVINGLQPDIWTIQELGGSTSNFSANTARSFLVNFIQSQVTIFGANPVDGVNFYVYVGTRTDGFIGNAIVSRYPLLSTTSYSDAGGGFGSLRGMTFALADLPGAVDLGVFTSHLKSGNLTTDAQRRQAQATTNSGNVASWLAGRAVGAAVVTGDFNETEDAGSTANWSSGTIGTALPDGTPYRPITTMKSPGLADAAPGSIDGIRFTLDSTSPDVRFDYTLYTPVSLSLTRGEVFDTAQYSTTQLNALRASTGINFLANDTRTASDHLPVFTVFNVVPEPATGGLLALGALMLCRRPRRRTR